MAARSFITELGYVVGNNPTADTQSFIALTGIYVSDVDSDVTASGSLLTPVRSYIVYPGVYAIANETGQSYAVAPGVYIADIEDDGVGKSAVARTAAHEAERRRATVYHRQQENLKYNLEALRLREELEDKKRKLAEVEDGAKKTRAKRAAAAALTKQKQELEARLAIIAERELQRIELQLRNAETMIVLGAVM